MALDYLGDCYSFGLDHLYVLERRGEDEDDRESGVRMQRQTQRAVVERLRRH
jgi:hypothetical protein